jgi:hypothetical protein
MLDINYDDAFNSYTTSFDFSGLKDLNMNNILRLLDSICEEDSTWLVVRNFLVDIKEGNIPLHPKNIHTKYYFYNTTQIFSKKDDDYGKMNQLVISNIKSEYVPELLSLCKRVLREMNPNLVEMSLNEVESIKTFDDEILSNVLMGDRSMFGFLEGGKIVGAILERLSDEYTSYLTNSDKTAKNNIKRDIEILKGEVKRKINMNINILNSYIPNKNNEEKLKDLIVNNKLFLSGNNLENLHELLVNIKSRYEYVNERLSKLTDSGPSINESIDIIENCREILKLVAKLDPEYLKTSENDPSKKDVDKDGLKNAVDEILQRYNNTEQSNNTRQVNTTTSNASQNKTGDLDEGIKMINTIKTVLGVTNSTTQIPLLSRLINMMDDDVTKLNI